MNEMIQTQSTFFLNEVHLKFIEKREKKS